MKARIHDFGGRNLRIEVTPENNDERLLLRAFLREHEGMPGLSLMETDAASVTFGRPAPKVVEP